jgi:hypothetical protein
MKKTKTSKLLLHKSTLNNLATITQQGIKGGATRQLSCKETCVILSCAGTCANSCPLTCMSCEYTCDL